jgi:hypothetical protein
LKEQSEKYNWKKVTFPTKLKHIKKWEKDNDIGVNVFGFDEEKKKIYTLKLTSLLNSNMKIINLYLHNDSHYCPITDMSRLLSSQVSTKEHKKCFCLRCIIEFGSEELLKIHDEWCSEKEMQRTIYPTDNEKWLKFKAFNQLHKIPFVVYADFECFELKPIEKFRGKNSMQYQEHVPIGFCFIVKCIHEDIYPSKLVIYTTKKQR